MDSHASPGRSPGASPFGPRAPLRPRLALTLASFAVYFAAFPVLADGYGDKAAYASLLPAIVAAAMLGTVQGSAAVALLIVCSTVLGVATGVSGWAYPVAGLNILGTFGYFLMCALAGRVRTLSEAAGARLVRAEAAEAEVRRLAEQERALRMMLGEENRCLAEVSAAKTKFLSFVNHEMKTPLSIMVGFAELLRMNTDGNLSPAQTDRLRMIERNGRRLSVMVTDLVDVARIESGQMAMNLEATEVTSVLSEVLESFAPILANRAQTLVRAVPDSPVWVKLDRERYAQVITNLVANACKYSPNGSTVTVEVKTECEALITSVTDHGVGISAQDQKKLFAPFARVISPQTRDIPGTGLGLHLSRSIIELHGGKIELQSEEGEGSTFTVVVPGVLPGRPEGAAAQPEGRPSARRAVRFRETVDAAA